MMSASADLQRAVAEILESGVLPAGCAVICRREKELRNDIEAAVKNFGMCAQVLPPLPKRALQQEQPFVFFDQAEVRVRLIEQPALNQTGKDIYDLVDLVALALHWSNPGGMLAHPLMLAEKPVEVVESKTERVMDVLFEAQYQLGGAN